MSEFLDVFDKFSDVVVVFGVEGVDHDVAMPPAAVHAMAEGSALDQLFAKCHLVVGDLPLAQRGLNGLSRELRQAQDRRIPPLQLKLNGPINFPNCIDLVKTRLPLSGLALGDSRHALTLSSRLLTKFETRKR